MDRKHIKRCAAEGNSTLDDILVNEDVESYELPETNEFQNDENGVVVPESSINLTNDQLVYVQNLAGLNNNRSEKLHKYVHVVNAINTMV